MKNTGGEREIEILRKTKQYNHVFKRDLNEDGCKTEVFILTEESLSETGQRYCLFVVCFGQSDFLDTLCVLA